MTTPAAIGRKLTEYRRKRDFRVTAEPRGGIDVPRLGRPLAFVVQKHAASHLHYDLRLELAGVMKSWAVPKGPSLNPAVRRLAVQVEDHPMEYNNFEGVIPPGEYGGGTVMLWDRGTYLVDDADDLDQQDAMRRALTSGRLSITFFGERMRGSFALVRTRRGDKPQWLLMKRHDRDASTTRDIVAEATTSVTTGRRMEEIAGRADATWRRNRA